ncbi:hypothetical protein ACINK0_03955 [Deinococcus sp. VB343]|uniref:Immunity protein 52 domain-containing protein n=1 Tax=Deinococcus sp. VB142 TaxID=3112952 RepID=A0AAU6Q096_9DEIO
MTFYESPPPTDLLSAIQEAYLEFAWHESVGTVYDLNGEPDEAVTFEGFCSGAGAVRGLDEMRRMTNAILNATFYAAAFATSQSPGNGPHDFDFDSEIPALYVAADHLPREGLLNAIEATLDLTPWVGVEYGDVIYRPAAAVHDSLVLKRDLILSGPAAKRYAPADGLLLLPAVAAIAAWLVQQRRPVRFPSCELDVVVGKFLKRGQMA